MFGGREAAQNIEKARTPPMPPLIQRLTDGSVTSPVGFRAGALHSGIKSDLAKPDLALLVSDFPSAAAATFTQNRFAAAPVVLDRERIASGRARAIVVNSGNANACTGQRGLDNARQMAAWAAKRVDLPADQVLVASTGIIGHHLPMEKIRNGLERLELSADGGLLAAEGIMTTDTRRKSFAVQFEIGGKPVRIGGMCKGAGMIHPNMATMLCFITSDAECDPAFARAALKNAVVESFNMITIDGDTSTNDTCMLLANGASGVRFDGCGAESALFQQALNEVAQYLAQAIVADGEGAERTMRVEVRGAVNEREARLAARAVAGSALTKAALHGADPNWGRILCAVGYSGAECNPDLAELLVGGVTLVRDGAPLDFDQAAASAAMRAGEVDIVVDLHQGGGRAVAWGCELTEAYVVENSAYST
jgi:glutamate N-acetyltransferase / amino-acid N-acetyltransferase